MHNAQFVQILHSRQNLLQKLSGGRLRKLALLDDVVEQLAAFTILHDHVELLRGLNNFVEVDDVWVPDQLEYVDLARHALYVRDFCDPLLFQNFDCHLLVRENVVAQLHFAERAFSDRAAEDVVPDGLGAA